jgi:8-oxo-dGTP pyrophosphatase MutT (NUDIX family)
MSIATGGPDWIQQLQELIDDPGLLVARQELRARYSPQLSYGRHFAPAGPTAKPAAVMVLIHIPQVGDWQNASIPLTVRPQHLPDHPGQISFPGGRLEATETYVEAAIREFQEELGVASFPGQVIGPLMPIWVFNSDYWLQPYLAIHTGSLSFQPCPREVDRLIQFPLASLLETRPDQAQQFSRGNVSWSANVFEHQGDMVWGVTAVILGELAAILKGLRQ